MGRTIPLAQYIFRRLQQSGCHAVHGVPGDFTLRALDHLEPSGLKWIGSCNELNAGYAADGYARIKGLGALFTTYGVGELSAINAVAGSRAESVPVVHIVGLPQTKHMRQSQGHLQLVHHMMTNTTRRLFSDIHHKVTSSRAFLGDQKAPQAFDNALRKCLSLSGPAYVELPSDMIDFPVDEDMLQQPIVSASYDEIKPAGIESLATFIDKINAARQPLLLVDRALSMDRHRLLVNELVRKTGIPTLTMPSGASMVDHEIPNYFGVHAGPVGQIDTMPYLEGCDLVVSFGAMFSDTQTLGWKTVPPASKLISVTANSIVDNHSRKVNWYERTGLSTASVLHEMVGKTTPRDTDTIPQVSLLGNFRKVEAAPIKDMSEPVDQTSFYLRLNRYLRPDDIIILGNATPILGGRDFILPPGAKVIASGLWFSIGHMLPAAQGVALAQQHNTNSPSDSDSLPLKPGRTILLDGDGSFQVTAQELSTIIRLRLNVTILIINNSGYAYERHIHGMHASYNSLAPWSYTSLPSVLGGPAQLALAAEQNQPYAIDTFTIRTWHDLEHFLTSETFDNGKDGKAVPGLKLVEVIMGKYDVPEKFKAVFKSAGEALRYQKKFKQSTHQAGEAEAETKAEAKKIAKTEPKTKSKPNPKPPTKTEAEAETVNNTFSAILNGGFRFKSEAKAKARAAAFLRRQEQKAS